MSGIKHDQGKAPISLIPVEAITGEAEVFAFGAQKYGRHNFRKGMDHSRVLDAALRHILAIVNGEDTDPESGKPHWAHARCCLAMYAFYQQRGVGNDDRFKSEKLEPVTFFVPAGTESFDPSIKQYITPRRNE